MYSRITITTTKAEIADLFELAHDMGQLRPPSNPRYNVAPSAMIPVVRMINGNRELTEMRWD